MAHKNLKSFEIMDSYRGRPYKTTVYVTKITFNNKSLPKYKFDYEHPRYGDLIKISIRANSLEKAKKKFKKADIY